MTAANRTLVFASNHATDNKRSLTQLVHSFAKGVWSDFKTTNTSTAGKAVKMAAGPLLIGSRIAQYYETYTPLQWALRGFGPLPLEFSRSGTIRIFTLTPVQRAISVGAGALVRFALVTAAYEGGVLVGSVINQKLSKTAQDQIGGTINEIVNEGGWRELRKHPFGIGL
jgi:hypothetical protein